MDTARHWLERIRALPLPPKVRIMNVCGGHERSIAAAGLRTALPEQIELIAGPGCPVCICPEEDVYEAIQLALHERVVLLAFGDMLRVPVNVPRSEPRSLEQAKAAVKGGDDKPAQRHAQQAELDVDLALAKAQNATVRKSAAELQASIDQLRQETQRPR